MISDKWLRTNDIQGHKELFPIRCRFCKEDMFLRYSQILMRKNKLRGADSDCNQMAYKCGDCGYVVRFNVTDKRRYLKWILRKRQGITLWYPPKSTWANIKKRFKQQLESLGYLGGR